jgi:hypothetical protein
MSGMRSHVENGTPPDTKAFGQRAGGVSDNGLFQTRTAVLRRLGAKLSTGAVTVLR